MMPKRLTTTVHFVDPDTGESRVVGPGRNLSRADEKQLREAWGNRFDAMAEDVDVDPEDVPQREQLEGGHPLADSAPADDSSPQVEEAMEVREETRTERGRQAAVDAGHDEKDLARRGQRK